MNPLTEVKKKSDLVEPMASLYAEEVYSNLSSVSEPTDSSLNSEENPVLSYQIVEESFDEHDFLGKKEQDGHEATEKNLLEYDKTDQGDYSEANPTETDTECFSPMLYLQYGGDESALELDLEGTLHFLTEHMKYDGGELTKARNNKNVEAMTTGYDSCSDFCAYCGIPILGVDYYLLPDGRKRCGGCTRSLIKSKEELEQIFHDVVNNMEVFFNMRIDAPIFVEFIEEQKLKKKIRKEFSRCKQFEWYSGVGIFEKNRYTIYLENGAPRISVISTLVYELTSIWQYQIKKRTGLKNSFKKYVNSEDYIGMSTWVEIQYLYFIGEQTVAKRKESFTLMRNDKLSQGLQKLMAQYPFASQPDSSLDTPFTHH